MGLRAFHNVMNEKRFEGVPMILETPIDRPVEAARADEIYNQDQGKSEDEDQDTAQLKNKTKKKSTPAKQLKKPATFEDKSVWAREIKLLESLIGMDVESEEFRALEVELAEQGSKDRKKQQEAFDRKKEKNAKANTRTKKKGKTKASEDEKDEESD